MTVLTLNSAAFTAACRDLYDKVNADGYQYDMLVGIASGGVFVAAQAHAPNTFSITHQRASTASKQGKFKKIVKKLPRRVNDLLRCIESVWLGFRERNIDPEKLAPAILPDELAQALEGFQGRILVVDDAVDSGATLVSVYSALSMAAPQAEIRSAAITITRPNPLITPDYYLYFNRTLVRFPWSSDF